MATRQSKPAAADDFAHVRPNFADKNEAESKQAEVRNARASRYHRVFVQHEDGKKILEEWTNNMLFGQMLSGDTSLFAAGIAEGRRQVVKDIINQINIIEAYRNE